MILLIESGSTKTAWRYITQANEAFESFQSPGINPYYQTAEQICDAQQEVLQKIQGMTLRFVYYFGTGITDESKKDDQSEKAAIKETKKINESWI